MLRSPLPNEFLPKKYSRNSIIGETLEAPTVESRLWKIDRGNCWWNLRALLGRDHAGDLAVASLAQTSSPVVDDSFKLGLRWIAADFPAHSFRNWHASTIKFNRACA